MVVGVLGFEGRAQVIPAYAGFDGRRSESEAHAGLHAADNTQLATVVGQLRFDQVTDDYVAGQLSGGLVWRTRGIRSRIPAAPYCWTSEHLDDAAWNSTCAKGLGCEIPPAA